MKLMQTFLESSPAARHCESSGSEAGFLSNFDPLENDSSGLQCLFRNVSNAVPWGPCLTGLTLLANTVWATVSLRGGGCGRSLAAETPWPCFIGGIYPKQEKNTQETQGHAKNNIWSGLFKQHQEVAQYDAMCYIKRC